MRIGSFLSRPTVATNTSASGAASLVTIAAVRDQAHTLYGFGLTYNGGTPGTKAVTIGWTQNGTAMSTVIGVACVVSVTAIIELPSPIVGDANTAITVSAALLASNTNTVDAFYA